MSELPFKITDRFPEYGEYPSQAAAAQYVLRVLVDLAKRGELFLSELLPPRRQNPAATFAVGNILAGQELSAGGNLRPMHSLPRELLAARVVVRSTPFLRSTDRREPDGRMVFDRLVPWVDTVRWTDKRPIVGSTPEKSEALAAGANNCVTGDAVAWQSYAIDTGKTEVQLPLREAWMVLKAFGAYCCPAKRAQTRASAWRYREVNALIWPADGEPLVAGAWPGELPLWAGGLGRPVISEKWIGDDEIGAPVEEPRRRREVRP